MKTQLTTFALALVTLATLGTACDVEPTLSSDELEFRGDELDPPRPTTGGGIIIKGGHDLPTEILDVGFDRAAFEYQLVFEQEVEKQVVDFFEQQFLSSERMVDWCISTCEHQSLPWDGGVLVRDLELEHGAVTTERDAEERLVWVTEVDASADVACACG